jgi:hypothetical protein
MARELREPASPAEFNALTLTGVTKRITKPWWNLRWAKYSKPGTLMFATKSGRLTPVSGKVPCLYLAQNRETSFEELYGDDIDAAKKRGRTFLFAKTDLENRIYLKTTEELTLKLYDLTAAKSAKRIGLDLGTLYTPQVDHPRLYAQRLHDHPARFDGIQYLSRQTQSMCIVLWGTHSPSLEDVAMEKGASLWDLTRFDRSLSPGSLRLFDAEIQVAASPKAV